jgi:hypothetical protein
MSGEKKPKKTTKSKPYKADTRVYEVEEYESEDGSFSTLHSKTTDAKKAFADAVNNPSYGTARVRLWRRELLADVPVVSWKPVACPKCNRLSEKVNQTRCRGCKTLLKPSADVDIAG